MSGGFLVKRVMAAALAMVVAAPVVLAADLGGRRPSYKDDADFGPPRYLWTGMYLGLQAGYGWGTSRHVDALGVATSSFDMDGFVGGGTLGYNLQAGQVVWGVETDFSFSDMNGATNVGPAIYTSAVDWLWTVRGRVGLDMNGWMPYITGGLAVADINAASLVGVAGTASNSDTRAGWTVGAGLEVKMDRNWSFKAEYLYVDLGQLSVATPTPIKADFDNLHIVRGGLNYKF